MDASQKNRNQWFRQALAEYERPLTLYARQITGDLEIARDVVQDTFLRLCQAERAKVDGHLAAWLYTVCRNRALDVRKKEGRMEPLTDGCAEAFASPGPSPRATAEQNELHGIVLAAMATLTDKQREAFQLKFQSGLTYKEISEVTGFPVQNVRYLIHSSLQTVRDRLRREGGLIRNA